MKGMSRKQWRNRPFLLLKSPEPEIMRNADMPPPVDVQELKREAIAARELMKELT